MHSDRFVEAAEDETSPRPRRLVEIRRSLWRVLAEDRHEDVTALRVARMGGAGAEDERTLLSPFDRVVGRPEGLVRVVNARRWGWRLHRLLRTAGPAGAVWGLEKAKLTLLPYQLEPALAVLNGATRVLLADEVGLGKTIEAGAILLALASRGRAGRVLVLTPAGLTEQWSQELHERFGLPIRRIDSLELQRLVRSLPRGQNPWSLSGIQVASIDLVKQPEVRKSLETIVWDALIVDEAHAASRQSDRGALVLQLAERARVVVLATATPHSGDEEAFRWLVRVGRLLPGEPLFLFRRKRRDVGAGGSRRVRLLRIRPTAGESEMHRLLDAYIAEVGSAGDPLAALAMMVLRKRAFSSAGSLGRSVARRLAWLGRDADPSHQLPLFDDGAQDEDAEPTGVLYAKGLASEERERRWLEAILAAARAAAPLESKRLALARLVRRVGEPIIVFTEFRDTLVRLYGFLGRLAPAAVLHGQLTAGERRDALDSFRAGRARLLLTTDVASEGLNLQGNCRLVVSYELPWSPLRLEQRIGRVDRLGQQRAVHAIHLVAAGTSESIVLGRLTARLEVVRRSVGEVPDVLGGLTSSDVAKAVMAGAPLDEAGSKEPAAAPGLTAPSYRRAAEAEVSRLLALRSEAAGRSSRRVPRRRRIIRDDRVLLTRLRVGDAPVRAGHGRMLLFYEVEIADPAGELVERSFLPLSLISRLESSGGLRARVMPMLEKVSPDLERFVVRHLGPHLLRLGTSRAPDLERRLRRESALLRGLRSRTTGPVQAGLFDSRVTSEAGWHRAEVAESVADCARRLDGLERTGPLQVRSVRLVLAATGGTTPPDRVMHRSEPH